MGDDKSWELKPVRILIHQGTKPSYFRENDSVFPISESQTTYKGLLLAIRRINHPRLCADDSAGNVQPSDDPRPPLARNHSAFERIISTFFVIHNMLSSTSPGIWRGI